jgi:choline dehydrogenase-like flavoprotein
MSHNYKRFLAGPNAGPSGNQQGYPVPGPQAVSAEQIAGGAFFAGHGDWDAVANADYDFIVIGSGPTAVAFVEQSLKHNPRAAILMLERGPFWLPTHYQMLPTAFQATTSLQTTYPWSRTSEMATTGMKFFQAGYIPALGGRSTYWSAWCPAPDPDLMRDWPPQLVDTTQQPGFWERARTFLHVRSMDEIRDGVYGALQQQLDDNLRENFRRHVPSAERAYPAPRASFWRWGPFRRPPC